jgi:RimJ/RimL family protein N-acetyltransferase
MTGPARFDTIGTDRLLMRRWLASDREPFAALNADPETMVFFPGTLDRAASDAFADRIEARFDQLGYGLWALEISATGEFMTAVLNEPSQAVMLRPGLTEIARFDHPRIPGGHPLQPHVTYHLARPQAS